MNFHYSEKWNTCEIIMRLNDQPRIFSRCEPDIIDAIAYPQIKRISMYDLVNIFNDGLDMVNSKFSEIKCKANDTHVYEPTTKLLINREMMNLFFNNVEKLYSSEILDTSNKTSNKTIGLISAGLADVTYILQAFIILTCLGHRVNIKTDIGINQISIMNKNLIDKLNQNQINLVIAGMENALTDVLATLTNKPILAVPSDVSYGYGNNGKSSLQSLLNSPMKGVGIFNITNVYSACIAAHKLLSCVKPFNDIKIYEPLTLFDILTSKPERDEFTTILLHEEHNGSRAGVISSVNPDKSVFVINTSNNKQVTKSILNICVPGIIYVNSRESFEDFCQRLNHNIDA